MDVSPGRRYIFELLPSLILPPLVTYGAVYALEQRQFLAAPTWVVVAAVALSKPLHLVMKVYYKRFSDMVKARKLGARVVPRVKEPWPYFAGISLLKDLSEMFRNGYVGDILEEWSKTYGHAFQVHILMDSQVWTTEPDHIKALLSTQFDNFEKGESGIYRNEALLGKGVFNSDGEIWRFHRNMTRPFFSRDKISDFELIDSYMDTTLAIAKQRLSEGYAIDFQDLVTKFALDSSCSFLFGVGMDCLSAGLAYPANSGRQNSREFTDHPSNAFADSFDSALYELVECTLLGNDWPLREIFGDRVLPKKKIVDQFIEPIVQRALEQRKGRDETEKSECLLQELLSQTQDLTLLKDELLNLLVAGKDSTSTTLTFAVYNLTQHPDITAKLRQEVFDKVGESRAPTFENIKEMKYLRAFINGKLTALFSLSTWIYWRFVEVFRLYPPVPFNERTSNKDTVLNTKSGSNPLFVPAGTLVQYSVYLMHRRKDLWGPDANIFDPDRFLDERLHKYLTPNPFIFLPFNAGPRICLGQQFAYNEISFCLVRILQQFSKFTLDLGAQPSESLPKKEWAAAEGVKGTDKIT
ncbi:cytochrome P450 monooxygenase pc-3 [Coprinopsis marcescibilis]|uniref:Cytochrome P450 monooxygenase pc-3 n=1 Tax=Coprinopsis marcescibilis TaxID=230819 RepID=A0A5C3KN57_COPMA|nr:cytochrome P450 monooxygenase pc-3 [Coprinopsis marcescibilis]